jgi:universal stress protein A
MRLLVAVDLNDGAEEVLASAGRWAERLSATLDVLYADEHAYNVYLVQDPSVRTVLDREWARIRETHDTRLAGLVASLPEAVRGRAVMVAGRATEAIVETAAGYDALVIATHGRKGLSHVLMGSVAERVIRNVKVPVLVVPMTVSA